MERNPMSLFINSRSVAYFSMEVALDSSMPTYAGGLGVLAGDTLRAAADLEVPLVGVSLLHRKGYFRQHLDGWGNQTESPAVWTPEQHLTLVPAQAKITVEGRTVHVRAWQMLVEGVSGHVVPVYFLDTALESNAPWDQTLTDHLYGGDAHYRLCQEVVLGMGGVALLRALGHDQIQNYHMNEGHSALLALSLVAEKNENQAVRQITPSVREAVRRQCVFTTHTPVPAGHDRFPAHLVHQVLGDDWAQALTEAHCCLDGSLNMTYLALYFSHYVNGVAMRHGEISRSMFPDYPVNSITNGVHATTWTSEPFRRLFDSHIPEWRRDNLYLRYAISIELSEIQQAHKEAKQLLLNTIERRTRVRLAPETLTIGFARRATPYKRPMLLFSDSERLRRIARQAGPLQIVYSGKAHPRDDLGKLLIRNVFEAASMLGKDIQMVYLPEYDMALAKQICAGVDVWLNTPQKPQEASGTSGMKAALNGVPSFSVLDGWWVEGHTEGVTGWAIGEDSNAPSDPALEAESLYAKLEFVIAPLFYTRPLAFAEVMRSAIALNGSFFNAQRMLGQYLVNAYGEMTTEQRS